MIQLLGDRVLVALPPAEETSDETTGYTVQDLHRTHSGLFVAKPTDQYNVEIASRGIVMQLGTRSRLVDLDDVRSDVHTYFVDEAPIDGGLTALRDGVDRVLMQRGPAPFEVQVGDCVVFAPSAGEGIEMDDVSYVILREADIIGIVAPMEKEAVA